MPMDIDETPKRAEHPRSLARRLSRKRLRRRWRQSRAMRTGSGAISWPPTRWSPSAGASCPRPKCSTKPTDCLHLLSGRSHRVYTGVCLITPDGQAAPEDRRDQGALQASFRARNRELSGLGPMARQGRRLRHPGAGWQLRRQAGGILHQCRRLPLYETGEPVCPARAFRFMPTGDEGAKTDRTI